MGLEFLACSPLGVSERRAHDMGNVIRAYNDKYSLVAFVSAQWGWTLINMYYVSVVFVCHFLLFYCVEVEKNCG